MHIPDHLLEGALLALRTESESHEAAAGALLVAGCLEDAQRRARRAADLRSLAIRIEHTKTEEPQT